MKLKTIPKNEESDILKFIELVSLGIESWVNAGKILNKMIGIDPGVRKDILNACPAMSIHTLIAFENIGRKTLYPHLLIEKCPALESVAALPYEVQEYCCHNDLEVVAKMDGATPQTIKLPLRALSRVQTKLLFSETGIRGVKDQCTILLQREPKKKYRVRQDENGNGAVKKTSLGKYMVRIGASGALLFERTNATVSTAVPVHLINGTAVVEVFGTEK